MRYSKLTLPLFLLSVLTMAACASGGSTGTTTTTEPTRPAASLDNVPWTLTYLEVNGQVHTLVPNVPVTLTFHEQDQTITGSSGINAYQATYQRLNSQIRFHDFAITLVGCGGSACSASKKQEDLYLQSLMQAETLLVSGKSMTVTGAGGQDLLRYSTS